MLANTSKVTKGILVVAETGFSIEFQFNPSEVSESHSPVYGQHAVPGASHPVYQFGAGGERTISFTIYLDAELGRSRGKNTSRFLDPTDNTKLSLSSVLNEFRSLTFPIESTSPAGVRLIYAPKVYLQLYSVFEAQRLECVVKKVDPRISYFSPELRPLRASIEIELAESPRRRVLATAFRGQGV